MTVRRNFRGASIQHDRRRHLSAVDLPLGGSARTTGLYYTQVKIGSPGRNYYMCVDTGSDLFWVKCDQKNLYYPSKSKTASIVPCSNELCFTGPCKTDSCCDYRMSYQDGSSTKGYLVTDLIELDVLTKNFTTSLYSSSVVLGCGVHQHGSLAMSVRGLDGIVGFGRAKMSFISQLTGSGLVGRSFGHCLDGNFGGGIFVIGRVDYPKVKTTPLIGNRKHYTINLLAIDVDAYTLPLGSGIETVIDSGSTLAYFPEDIYEVITNKILSNHLDLKLLMVKESYCFNYTASVDMDFPTITLHFENSLLLIAYPQDYLLHYEADKYCMGWRSSGSIPKGTPGLALLGDLVLSNKFVLYDIENETIGWTEYNCTSSLVGVYDEPSSTVYEVSPHRVYAPPHDNSAAHTKYMGRVLVALLCVLFLFCGPYFL